MIASVSPKISEPPPIGTVPRRIEGSRQIPVSSRRIMHERQGEGMPSELTRLDAIRAQVAAGKRLSLDDGLALEASNDLFALGAMANLVRERYNGNFGYYNVNTHINPTNVCVYTCDFCAFRADLNEAKAYVLDRAAVIDRARQAGERGATELHIVGGLHHKLPFTYYVDVVRWIKETAPEIHVKAYTAVEIEFFAKISRLATEQVLRQLIAAGLGSLPGGGAEIFHPENSEMAHIPKPSGVMDLKTMAISRLMLDNFAHIKAYWVMLGLKTAQVALWFGADDLDGTVVHEKIYHDAGAETPQEATVAEIRRLITEAGRVPIERDTLYHQVVRNGSRWSSGEHIEVAALVGVGSARD